MNTEELFTENMPLVPYIYKKYKNKFITPNIDDLLQEGYIGLLKACEKYDSDRDVKFSTFAWSYIYGHMLRFCNEDKLIHIPLYKLKEVHDYIKSNNNKETYEMSDELEIIKELNNVVDITEFEETEYMLYNQFDVDFYNQYNFTDVIDIAKDILTEREYNITMEYTLEDTSTLESIGKKYHITRERVRQIIAHSYRKLRENSKLRQYRKEL